MFNLEFLNFLFDEKRKKFKILDCPSGASSFVGECKMKKIDAYCCDPQYNNERDDVGDVDNLILLQYTI